MGVCHGFHTAYLAQSKYTSLLIFWHAKWVWVLLDIIKYPVVERIQLRCRVNRQMRDDEDPGKKEVKMHKSTRKIKIMKKSIDNKK